jgi:hypothetical protein
MNWRTAGIKRVGLHYIAFGSQHLCGKKSCGSEMLKYSHQPPETDELGLGRGRPLPVGFVSSHLYRVNALM